MVPSTTYRNTNNNNTCNDMAKICASAYDHWQEQPPIKKAVYAIGGTLVFGAVVAGVVFWAMSDCTNVTIHNKSGSTMHFDDGVVLYNGYSLTRKLPTSGKNTEGFKWGDIVQSNCDLVLQKTSPYAEVTKCNYPNAFVDFPGCSYDIKDKYQTPSASVANLLSHLGSIFQSKPATKETSAQSFNVNFTEEELDLLQAEQEEVIHNLRGSHFAG